MRLGLDRLRRLRGRATAATSATAAADPGKSAFWQLSVDAAYAKVGSSAAGLSAAEAASRLASAGKNAGGGARRTNALALLVRQFESPIVLILIFATVVSGLLGDTTDATIILAIIVLSGLLGFWQERGASRAVEALLAVVQVKADVVRGSKTVEAPVHDVVPGDVVALTAGDVIPGDCLLTDSNSLLVDEATLTGETFPVEKGVGTVPTDAPITKRTNSLFLGTHVVSGSGTALVMRTGASTEFGRISSRLGQKPTPTGFQRGMTAFGFLLLRVMLVLVAAIFVINMVLGRPLIDAALFSLALAVGLTPQLLPAIVTISLSQGARAMARQKVIVKRLDAIEDFGAMTVLCTDKTGTLTLGTVQLEGALDVDGKPSPRVLRFAALNSHFQRGFANLIDQAIVASEPKGVGAAKRLDELPYDFTRKRLSVLVNDGGSAVMITKGALDNVVAACSRATRAGSHDVAMSSVVADLRKRYEALSRDGLRVLGVATRAMPKATRLNPKDEAGMTFVGFLTFLDPPKIDVKGTLADLAANGISVRMITGDNRFVAEHVAGMVGLPGTEVVSGDEIEHLDDKALAARVADVSIFAEIEPAQKERIIRALRVGGRVVGYMGDGINDAPALHAADVGISVDTAVDVAKESAAIVLLAKDLRVLLDGVRQGRRTFANTMKYVFTTTSASFGNVLSMAAASAFLPFLPLLADQILLINFLTDFPSTTIATDNVDEEQLARPHNWDVRFVRDFMIVFGLVSSAFDFLTFGVLLILFKADTQTFRSGWFLESVATELLVLFVLRTRRPFFRSTPSRILTLSSAGVAILTVLLLYSPFAQPLGLDALPLPILVTLISITALYVAMTEIAKRIFYGRSQTFAAEAI